MRLAFIGRFLACMALVSCAWVLWTLAPTPHALRLRAVHAAGAFVQDAGNTVGGSVSTNTQAFGSNTVAGNAIIVFTAFLATTADVGLCSDTQGNHFSLYASDAVGANAAIGVCAAFNIVGGADTVTCRSLLNPHSSFACYVMEVSGTFAVDAIGYKQGSNSTSISYTTTTNLSGDFIAAGLWTSGSAGTITNGSGWSHNLSVDFQYQVAGAAGGYTTNWNWTSTTTGVSVSIALKAGSTPAVGTSSSPTISPIVQPCGSNSSMCAMPNHVTSGDILLAHASVATGSFLTTPTDTLSTSWTLLQSCSTQAVTDVWIGTAASSGADTVTFNGTFSAIGDTVTELNPALVSTTADFNFCGSFEGQPGFLTTPSATASVNGDYLFLATGGSTGSTIPWPNSPMLWITGSQGQMAAGQVLGAAAPQTATFNTPSFTAGNYALIALKPAASITIETTALPSASLTHSYSYCAYAVQGTGSYTWSISSGSLPTGLSISGSTGCISGTPTGGTQTFTVQATDGTHTATKPLTLTVNANASTPSFVQAQLSQLGTTLALTSVGIGDVLWVSHACHPTGGAGFCATPADSLGTVFHPVTNCSTLYSTSINGYYAIYVWAGQATSSGADTVTVNAGSFTPSVIQAHNVQPFYDNTICTEGTNTTAAQTFTSTSLTTPAPNSLSLGVSTSQGNPSTYAAQSPYTDAGNLLLDGNNVDLGYDVVSAAGSTAFASAVTGANVPNYTNMAMTNLRPTTSGTVAGSNHRRAWVIER